MKLVFDRKTLQVISLVDDDSFVEADGWLRSVYPNRFKDLDIWQIRGKVYNNPVGLVVGLDEQKNPNALLRNGRVLYQCSEEEKKEYEERIRKRKKHIAEKRLPRSLLRSITSDTIKMWKNSPRTDAAISAALQSFEYFTDKPIMPVSWWGPFTDAGGYANMNREIVFRLHNYHVIPKIEICPTAPQVTPLTRYHISRYVGMDFSRVKKYPRIWSFTPIPHPSHRGKNVYFTMMETETIHPEFVRLCNKHSDEVWVPSNHNKEVFNSSGVSVPIHVMPLGIDETIYAPMANPELGIMDGFGGFEKLVGRNPSKGIKEFKFISLFGWSYRKGPDILIKSFVEEFDASDDVALIIVARHSGSSAPQHVNLIKQEAERYAKSVRKSNFPQIVLYPHVTPEHQMPPLYRMGHAFVHTSRGEGFSLPQVEASACGLPIISCNNTGMGHYLRDDNAFLIKTNKKEVCSPEMHWITSYYHGQLFPKLGRDQIDQTKAHMRYVVDNYSQAVNKGRRLTEEVFAQYTWRHAAERVAKRIEEIYREG